MKARHLAMNDFRKASHSDHRKVNRSPALSLRLRGGPGNFLLALVVTVCGELFLAPVAFATAVYAARLILVWGDSGNSEVGYKIARALSATGP
jgi:hypothetical protein